MGGEQAAGVLATVQKDGMAKQKKQWTAAEEEKFKAPIRAKYEHEGMCSPTLSSMTLGPIFMCVI
jgi:3-methylcrotonyl-CoA carboxylase beta subunit